MIKKNHFYQVLKNLIINKFLLNNSYIHVQLQWPGSNKIWKQ